MSGTIVLTRVSNLINYKARKFQVLVDGNHAGDVKDGQTLEIAVDPGTHSVVVKIDYHTSNEVTVLVSDGGKTAITCSLAKGANGILKSFTSRGYVELQVVDPKQLVATATGVAPPPQEGTSSAAEPKSTRASEGRIFISYRRTDSEHVTGRIYDRLTDRFGRNTIFKDVDSIPLGVDFREYLNQSLSACEAALVIIGKEWETLTGADGTPRLKQPVDHVRVEVELALERKIPVIPLMVRRTHMPDPSDLPESIRPLSYRNGIPIRPDPDFQHDIERLIVSLEEIVGSQS